MTVREAIAASLRRVSEANIKTRWSDAGALPGDPDWASGTTFEYPSGIDLNAPAEVVYWAVCRIGGGNGWYAADILWRLRGLLDRMVGGPGLRRGRRDPENIRYGDALDFWRVTRIEPNRLLHLRAEMKLPGEALLGFDIEPLADRPGWTQLHLKALFKPRGLTGILYWYLLLPFHGIIFNGMLKGIQQATEEAVERLSTKSPAA
jgi:hypothetical protein